MLNISVLNIYSIFVLQSPTFYFSSCFVYFFNDKPNNDICLWKNCFLLEKNFEFVCVYIFLIRCLIYGQRHKTKQVLSCKIR